ncbi:hypothetical protein HGRIS_001396 [Hohenbuehelia grisea]|uniref:C2H2-type domain-containing protein n=1 Tax=Hohenbuehelia grisea TaxID=104357 RepID=A0ABR3JQH6_9AGAR
MSLTTSSNCEKDHCLRLSPARVAHQWANDQDSRTELSFGIRSDVPRAANGDDHYDDQRQRPSSEAPSARLCLTTNLGDMSVEEYPHPQWRDYGQFEESNTRGDGAKGPYQAGFANKAFEPIRPPPSNAEVASSWIGLSPPSDSCSMSPSPRFSHPSSSRHCSSALSVHSLGDDTPPTFQPSTGVKAPFSQEDVPHAERSPSPLPTPASPCVELPVHVRRSPRKVTRGGPSQRVGILQSLAPRKGRKESTTLPAIQAIIGLPAAEAAGRPCRRTKNKPSPPVPVRRSPREVCKKAVLQPSVPQAAPSRAPRKKRTAPSAGTLLKGPPLISTPRQRRRSAKDGPLQTDDRYYAPLSDLPTPDFSTDFSPCSADDILVMLDSHWESQYKANVKAFIQRNSKYVARAELGYPPKRKTRNKKLEYPCPVANQAGCDSEFRNQGDANRHYTDSHHPKPLVFHCPHWGQSCKIRGTQIDNIVTHFRKTHYFPAYTAKLKEKHHIQ